MANQDTSSEATVDYDAEAGLQQAIAVQQVSPESELPDSNIRAPECS